MGGVARQWVQAWTTSHSGEFAAYAAAGGRDGVAYALDVGCSLAVAPHGTAGEARGALREAGARLVTEPAWRVVSALRTVRRLESHADAAVPVCAVIMDGEAAVVIDHSRTPRMVRPGAELESLCSLAERLWERGAEVRRLRRTPGTAAAQRPRMQMVLRLLADGLTDDAIARRLGCSVRTVRNDVAAAMAALDARSRFQAGARAMRAGLI
ncbi:MULTISPECIES: LuxR C-terminal-related transcriptional regulator [unclassified Streptomyces]|uniref:helix-turn-helix transcriptional regulator n=1 Tax=unclassified Streptomyces TaxID=2593676 RepID=UPI0033F0EC22